MQKLKQRDTYTPTNASQVCSSINLKLNSNESDSVSDGLKNDKLTLNTPEVNLLELQGLIIIVIDKGNYL